MKLEHAGMKERKCLRNRIQIHHYEPCCWIFFNTV